MVKKCLATALALMAAFFLASCSKETKPITLVMAEVNPDGTISAEMDKAFKSKVEELSDGKIKIDLHFGGTIGDEVSLLERMRTPGSRVHISRISIFNMVPHGCPKSALLIAPYTFRDKDHFWNFAASDLAQEILAEPYENNLGLRGLFFAEEGFRHFFSTKPLSKAEDFKDLLVRVTPDAVLRAVVEGLGAQPVSIGFEDLFTALQTGKAEAADQPLIIYQANHFYNIAPYMILDAHSIGVTEIIMAADAWDSLSEDQQAILLEAGKFAGEVCRKNSEEADVKVRKELEAEGAVFTEVEDFKPFQKACEKIISETIAGEEDLYEKILNL